MNPFYPYLSHTPVADPDGFIAPGALLIGDVTLAQGVGIWYNSVLRGDVNAIRIGRFSNIQDNSTVHADSGRSGLRADGMPTLIGNYVTVGHGCILHACTIEDGCLIGMGAIVLDGAVIGRGSVIGAGAVITKGTVIPPFSVAVGTPAKVIKTMAESSFAARIEQAEHYYRLAMENKQSLAGM
ncbi:MAG: gamma carbonic anhydrase family protein [Oscillospiraceae bacterium]